MSFISKCEDGSGWEVYLTAPDGDPSRPDDGKVIGRRSSLLGAAILMLEALALQEREAYEAERARLEKLERECANIKQRRVGVRNRIEHKEEQNAETVFPSFGSKGGRA